MATRIVSRLLSLPAEPGSMRHQYLTMLQNEFFVQAVNPKALLTTPRGRVTLTYLSKLTLYYHSFRQ